MLKIEDISSSRMGGFDGILLLKGFIKPKSKVWAYKGAWASFFLFFKENGKFNIADD